MESAFTPAMLEALSLCPMKYRLYGLGEAGGLTRRVDAARALHAAAKRSLDECYRQGGPGRCTAESLQETFNDCFDGAACADSREEDECRLAGLRILADYHADHRGDEVEGLRVDVAVEGEIGGALLRARADRREGRPDGSVVYIRYTTARQPPTRGPLQEDLRTGILQLLAEQEEGRPVEVEVHALRKRQVVDATKPPHALGLIEQRVSELVGCARAMQEPATRKGRHCRWCHARSVCPAWAGA